MGAAGAMGAAVTPAGGAQQQGEGGGEAAPAPAPAPAAAAATEGGQGEKKTNTVKIVLTRKSYQFTCKVSGFGT